MNVVSKIIAAIAIAAIMGSAATATTVSANCIENSAMMIMALEQKKDPVQWRMPNNFRQSSLRYPIIIGFDREKVASGIVHYEFTLKIGAGEYDKIALHRVVKTKRNGVPVRAKVSSFWIAGRSMDFRGNFLAVVPDSDYTAPAILMAKKGIDVWGMSPRHSFVPESEENLAFMKGWSEDIYLEDENFLFAVVRYYNEITAFKRGEDNPIPLILGGYSQGTRRAALNATQHQMDGLILIDMPGPLDPERDADIIAVANAAFNTVEEERKSGIYHDADMVGFKKMARLAIAYPEGISPVILGLTNKQAFLYALIHTKELGKFAYHQGFCAGDMEQGLYFAKMSTLFVIAEMANPYQPNSLTLAAYGQWAGEPEYQIPYNNIKCPVLNVEARLGMGDKCDLAAQQIAEGGNRDVTTIRFENDGHADPVVANNPVLWEKYLIPWMKSIDKVK